MAFMKDLEHLRVPFQDIKVATKNFTTIIGRGGFGPVYEGKLSLSGNLTRVAVKRLQNSDPSGQGLKEFLTEINLLSRYKHTNLVSLLGFCQEGQEKILIYEYAEHGSFEKYLKTLTWMQRLKICVDVARGLDYLHNRVGESHRIIHRDIKSANILLDENFKAKIADLGLSKIGRLNTINTFLITMVGGTIGYVDPVYMDTGVLSNKSDVYSFGVVLFEALCGRLCILNVLGEERNLVRLARRRYEQGKLNEIVDLELKDSESVKEFSQIAYQCLHADQEGRPSMDLVLQKLEKALELEETYELQNYVAAVVLQEVLKDLELQELEETYKLQEFVEALLLQEYAEACELQEYAEACELQKLEEAKESGEILAFETANGTTKSKHTMSHTSAEYMTMEDIYMRLSSGILFDDGKVMGPNVAPPQRPSSDTITTTHKYLHANEFPGPSRNTKSWGENNSRYRSNHGSSASATSSSKLRLMCSSGGHIVPRPHDKTLCYVGGETRMVVVDRQTTLRDLTDRLSKTLLRSSSSSTTTPMARSSSFTLKYQIPSEDLDSLISVTDDEDLECMIEEYERLSSSPARSKSSRLRLFLFPIMKLESVSSNDTSNTSFTANSTKSEDWFLSALNGTYSGFSDTY